ETACALGERLALRCLRCCFFVQAEDGIRYRNVTGVQTCALPILFCSFQQIPQLIERAEKYGFKNHIPLVFCKNYSPQVLKANMKIGRASCRERVQLSE